MNQATRRTALDRSAGRRYDPDVTPGQGRAGPRKPRARRSTVRGRKLTAVRSRLGLTQEQLAAKLGANLATVQRWETGESEPRGLYRVAVDRFLARQ